MLLILLKFFNTLGKASEPSVFCKHFLKILSLYWVWYMKIALLHPLSSVRLAFMPKHFFLCSATLLTLGFLSPMSQAEVMDDTKIAIDMSQMAATKNEIAVLQVLSEICPPMLGKNQQQGFANAYNIELKKLMPSLSNPKEAIQYLSTQQDYKKILADTRQWTLSYPKAENKEICTDLATYQY